MSEELKLNENVGAPQPDALAQIASVDPSPAVGGVHRFTPTMLSRIKEQRQLLSELEHALKNHEFCFFLQPKCNSMTRAIVGMDSKEVAEYASKVHDPRHRGHGSTGALEPPHPRLRAPV